MNSTAAAAVVGCRPPFTASQWEELENQALIFKYLISGIPVPPDLLLPIRRSYESMPARFYSHPALGYCSYYGKKLDPEPGRCRRTDGKKWRCSKDAYPDSKYCERHMHRGRNRSRKLVESQQALPQPPSSSSSTVTSLAPSSSVSSGSGTSGGFHALPFHSFSAAPISSRIHIDPASYGVSSAAKDFRYLHASKPELDKQHSLFSETSGNARGLTMDSSMDSSWRLMPSPAPSFPLSKERDDSFLHSSHLQVHPMQDIGQVAGSSLHQFSFLESEFSSLEPPIRTAQPLRPFFDEWPRTRDSWSDIEDERSNRTSFSTTQLSISIPMASSDFSTTSSRSPNED